MAKNLTNLFNNPGKKLEDRVVVKLSLNYFDKNGTSCLARVCRSTADDATVITEMMNHTDVIQRNDAVTAMTAFVDAVKVILAGGNAVRISGLGTFYLTAPGVVKTKNPTPADIGELDVSFTKDKDLHLVLSDTKVAAIVDNDTSPVFGAVLDLDSAATGSVTKEKLAELSGKMLRVAGAASDGCGLYIVPCDSDGNYKSDKSDWVRVADADIFKNMPTIIRFRVPASLNCTDAKLAICTKAPTSGIVKSDADLLKYPRYGISSGSYMVK